MGLPPFGSKPYAEDHNAGRVDRTDTPFGSNAIRFGWALSFCAPYYIPHVPGREDDVPNLQGRSQGCFESISNISLHACLVEGRIQRVDLVISLSPSAEGSMADGCFSCRARPRFPLAWLAQSPLPEVDVATGGCGSSTRL